MDLYVHGIHPDVLGSPRDVVLRQFKTNEMMQESRKLMTLAAASLGNRDSAKQLLQDFVNGQWGDLADTRQARYAEMQSYYDTYVKHLRPEASIVCSRDGAKHLKVTGLKELYNGE